MTLDEEYNKYKGQALLVPGADPSDRGQCFMWFDYVLHDVYGLPYFFAQSAFDIWDASFPGFHQVTDGSIKKGDIVVYRHDLPGSGNNGHVSVASQDGSKNDYVGYDSHWTANVDKNGFPILETIHHAGGENQYILGSLRRGGIMDHEDVNIQFRLGFNRDAVQPELDYWIGRKGSELGVAIYNDPANDQFRYKAINYDKDVAAAAQTSYIPYTGEALYTKKK